MYGPVYRWRTLILRNSFISFSICHFGFHHQHVILSKLNDVRWSPESKLFLYSKLKHDFEYENYLDTENPFRTEVTKFRLSAHALPVEKGRYARPIIERNSRLCNLCKNGIGDEEHVLFLCDNIKLKSLREYYMQKICQVHPGWSILPIFKLILQILEMKNEEIYEIVISWISRSHKEAKGWI